VFRKISLRRGKSSALDVAQVSSARVAFASSGKTLVLTIKSVSREPLKTHDGKKQEKTVLHFVETRSI
jgi:hypothetical protein